ncbi:hypothetical protein GCM10027614_73220 [Micromonospora vulcania]
MHVLVMISVLRWTGDWGTGFGGWRGPVVVLGFLVVNLVLAGLLHRYVETPLMRRLAPRRPAVPRQRTAPEAAVPEAAVPEAAVPEAAGAGSRVGQAGERSTYADSR